MNTFNTSHLLSIDSIRPTLVGCSLPELHVSDLMWSQSKGIVFTMTLFH